MNQRQEQDFHPEAVQAEKAILYYVFLFNDLMHSECSVLVGHEFSLDAHRKIFAMQREMIYAGEACDEMTLYYKIGREKLEPIGGLAYLMELGSGEVRVKSDAEARKYIGPYVTIVREKARLRDIMRYLDEGMDVTVSQRQTSAEIATRMIELLQDVSNADETNEIEHIGTYLNRHTPEQLFEQMRSKDGVPTGISDFDELTGGLQKQELIIVAARPSMGKTAWVAGVFYNAAVRKGLTVAGFVLEQNRKFIMRRMLSHAARVNYNILKRNEMTDRERETILERRQRILESPLYLEDKPGLTASRIRAKCMRLKSNGPLDLIIIDQLSHVDKSDVWRQGMQPREAVGMQTKMFKRLAQDLDVPVVVLNQLSREAGKRKDFRPTLADLKESGNIEEDADVVAFLHRPEYYERDNKDLKGKGQIIIEKNREGSTGTIDCEFHGQYMMWTQETPEPPSYDQRDLSYLDDYAWPSASEDGPRWR